MRFASVWLIAIFGLLVASSIIFNRDISRRSLDSPSKRNVEITQLVKRKGGGGGGKGGSSGGGKSSGSSSGSTLSSARGGTSPGGSGASRSYGRGGGYYGGGATVPYSAGGRTPKGLVPAAFLGVGALGFFGGAWLYGAYMYSYPRPYYYYNATSRLNESRPVRCLCQQFSVCGCDDNDDQTYFASVIGDGSRLNNSLVRVAEVNGTTQIFLNGTLPNGTTANGPSSAAPGLHVSPMTGAMVLATIVASAMFSL